MKNIDSILETVRNNSTLTGSPWTEDDERELQGITNRWAELIGKDTPRGRQSRQGFRRRARQNGLAWARLRLAEASPRQKELLGL